MTQQVNNAEELLKNFKLDGSVLTYEDSEEEEVVEGKIVRGAEVLNQAPVGDPIPARMVNYDQAHEEDDPGAIQNARDVRLPFNKHDVSLWFSLIESKMQFAGLKNQWSKRQVLVQLLPADLHNDFKRYLVQQESDTNNDAYYQLKKAIIKRMGPKRADGFDKAIARVMNGTPSQLGLQIINDICPSVSPLTGCHCADVVLGIWRRSLPVNVRNSVADMDFNATTYGAVFDKADAVWASNSSTTVTAALTAEVAAVSGRGGRRNNRGGAASVPQRGGNRGGGARGGSGGGRGRGRGPRHSDLPPQNACDVHWRHGKGAWHCADRHSCPWRDFESPKPRHNRNIVASAETEMEIIE